MSEQSTWDKIKGGFTAFLALLAGALFFMFRRSQKETAKAETELAKAIFKLTTQENDKEYEDAKARADRLVTEYQNASRSDTVE
jgi:hypothetical protein